MENDDDKDIHYDRVFNRARKSLVFESGGISADQLSKLHKDEFSKTIGHKICPIVSFWDSEEKWTAMTSNHIYSNHNGSFVSCHLDEIKDEIEGVSPDSVEHRRETLRTTEILHLKNPKIFVWAPPGEALHALWHILRYSRPLNK